MARVEEELKHQRELMPQGFEQVERRFEQVERRFEQVDKRLGQVEKHFEQVDRRCDELIEPNDRHFLWLIGCITTIAALSIAAGKLL